MIKVLTISITDREALEPYMNLVSDDVDNLSKLLNVSPGEEVDDFPAYFDGLDEYPPMDTLPPELITRIQDLGITPETSYDSYDYSTLQFLLQVRNILLEQENYFWISKNEPSCQAYYIVALYNSVPYGGIFAFYKSTQPEVLMIQGITKYLTAALAMILAPKASRKLPHLNSMLQPAITDLGERLRVDRIVVAPVGKQIDILEQHYGYIPTKDITYPCQSIKGSQWISKTGTYYYKIL